MRHQIRPIFIEPVLGLSAEFTDEQFREYLGRVLIPDAASQADLDAVRGLLNLLQVKLDAAMEKVTKP